MLQSASLPLALPVLPRVTLTGATGTPVGAGVDDPGLSGAAGDGVAARRLARVRRLLDGLADVVVRHWPRQVMACAQTDLLLHLVDPRQCARAAKHVQDCRAALGEAAPPQIALLTQPDGHGATETALLHAGCCAALALDACDAVLQARLAALLRLGGQAVRWRADARTDALTGLANRRLFDLTLQRECQRACRQQRPLSLLLVDVDHFKRYNDSHGHAAGDACLREIARVIGRLAQRPTDCAARHGGEEFALLLADTGADGAWVVAHRLLRGIRGLRLAHGAPGAGDRVSVSVGVATLADALQPVGPVALMEAADAALYAAKHQGRDRVCHGPGPGSRIGAMPPLHGVMRWAGSN